MNHVGKIAFKWVYWNMLLPGHLPNVPLLPSHMSFMGKDLTTAPQIRHARAMHVARRDDDATWSRCARARRCPRRPT